MCVKLIYQTFDVMMEYVARLVPKLHQKSVFVQFNVSIIQLMTDMMPKSEISAMSKQYERPGKYNRSALVAKYLDVTILCLAINSPLKDP